MIVEIGSELPVMAVGNSVSIENRISERSVARADILTGAGVHYQKGSPIYIYDDDRSVLLFGGIVEQSEEIFFGNDLDFYVLHRISATDWHYLADRKVVAFVYNNQKSGDIVKDMINGLLGNPSSLDDDGVSVGNVQDGVTLVLAIFNYVKVSRVLELLCNRNDYWWLIKPDKSLYFVPRTAYTAPFSLTSNDPVSESVVVRNSAPMYRNRQFLKGGKDITDQQVETQNGDGNRRTFVMSYSLNNEPTIEVSINGGAFTAKTVGIGGVETGFQWYWNKNTNEVFQDDGETRLAAVDRVRVTYYGQFDIVILTYDGGEIATTQAIEGFGTGQVDDVMDDVNVFGRDSAFQIASGELATYGRRGRTLEFETYREGLEAGQLLTVNLPEHEITNGTFLIESVEIVDY